MTATSSLATNSAPITPSPRDIDRFLSGELTVDDLAVPMPSVAGVGAVQLYFVVAPTQLPPRATYATHASFAVLALSTQRQELFGPGVVDGQRTMQWLASSVDCLSHLAWSPQPQRTTTAVMTYPTAHTPTSALAAYPALEAGCYDGGSFAERSVSYGGTETPYGGYSSAFQYTPVAGPSGSTDNAGLLVQQHNTIIRSGSSSQEHQQLAGATRPRHRRSQTVPHPSTAASNTCLTCGKVLDGNRGTAWAHKERCSKRAARTAADCTLCGKRIATHRADGFHKHLTGTSQYIQCESVSIALGGGHRDPREVTAANIGTVGTWMRATHPQIEADGWCVPGQWAGDSNFSQWLKAWASTPPGTTTTSGSESASS